MREAHFGIGVRVRHYLCCVVGFSVCSCILGNSIVVSGLLCLNRRIDMYHHNSLSGAQIYTRNPLSDWPQFTPVKWILSSLCDMPCFMEPALAKRRSTKNRKLSLWLQKHQYFCFCIHWKCPLQTSRSSQPIGLFFARTVAEQILHTAVVCVSCLQTADRFIESFRKQRFRMMTVIDKDNDQASQQHRRTVNQVNRSPELRWEKFQSAFTQGVK